MERIHYGKYSNEFRQEAVKLVIEGGLSIPEAGGWRREGIKSPMPGLVERAVEDLINTD